MERESTERDVPAGAPVASPRERVRPPAAFRLVEVGSIVACVGLEVLLGTHIVHGVIEASPGSLALLLAATLGYLAADLVSGLVHFVGDRFGTVHTPWLGSTFILPFRSHHARPRAICDHDFVETNGNNAFAALFALVPTALLVPGAAGGASTLFALFVGSFSLAVLLTNQIHKWAHVPRPPRVVRALQRAGLLLSPECHRPHHRPPHGRGYCVTSGLFNRVLDPLDFFPRLERALRAVAGSRPGARRGAARP